MYKVIVDIDKETSSSMVKKYCQNFHSIIGEKLWPYCGSSLAVSAAFLTGVDILAKIGDMVKSVTEKKRNVDINKWANDWIAFSKSVVATVISFMKELHLSSESSDLCEAAGTVEQNPTSDFDLLFVPPPNKALKFGDPITSNCLEEEVNMFQKLRQPSSQPYWKNEHRFPLLKAGAKVVLAVPVSSAAIERLFSAAGLLLSKFRRRMLPAVVINSVYSRFACDKEMVEKLSELTESSLTEAVEAEDQEIENLLNEHSDSE